MAAMVSSAFPSSRLLTNMSVLHFVWSFPSCTSAAPKQCHRMQSRACGKKLKRRRLFGERHFLDADTGFDPM